MPRERAAMVAKTRAKRGAADEPTSPLPPPTRGDTDEASGGGDVVVVPEWPRCTQARTSCNLWCLLAYISTPCEWQWFTQASMMLDGEHS